MKEDANEEANEEANNIKLEPVVSPSNQKQSPYLAPEQGEEADVQLVRILQSATEHPVLLPFSEWVKPSTFFSQTQTKKTSIWVKLITT